MGGRGSSSRFGYIGIVYEGPWDRLGTWLLGIDWRTNELRFEVKDGSLRDRLADFCDRRNIAWKRKWAARRKCPPDRWKRRR